MKNLCETCPRACHINREFANGFCKENDTIRIAKIIEHFNWEEPCLADERGTLAIFFSGCNLRCDYCQNFEISRGGIGKTYSIEEFCNLIEEKQSSHASIDLITPTHFSDALCKCFKRINKKIPVIWNTNGYETTTNISKVSKFVDIFLTDFKYADESLAFRFSQCHNYVSSVLPATKLMCKLKPDKYEKETLVQGVIIRHLVLPNHTKNSFKVLDLIKEHFPTRKISIMSQFTPNGKSELNRKITRLEYKAVTLHAEKLNLENGYIQDFDSANECFIPKFN